jgi:hypothetical protein
MRPSSNLRETKSFSEWTISADDADARVARAIRLCVGNHLRGMYGGLLNELSHRRLPTSCVVWIAGPLLTLRLGKLVSATESITSRRRNFARKWRNQ